MRQWDPSEPVLWIYLRAFILVELSQRGTIGRHIARFGLAATACVAGIVLWAGPAGANYDSPQIKIDFLGFPAHTKIST